MMQKIRGVRQGQVKDGARWDILGNHGGGALVFVTILILKCICLVFHGENGQNEYILIVFSFTNIVSIVACIDL